MVTEEIERLSHPSKDIYNTYTENPLVINKNLRYQSSSYNVYWYRKFLLITRGFCIFIVIAGINVIIYYVSTKGYKSNSIMSNGNFNITSRMPCIPGKFGDILTQLPLQSWTPPGKDYSLPLYSTHNLNEIDFSKKIYSALIIQHGNVRNANNYFCGAVNSLLESNLPLKLLESIIVIAPYFPIQGDLYE
jgi:peptidoglycan/xylan/chitin deacetylase (PgdA/CDA1 family)